MKNKQLYKALYIVKGFLEVTGFTDKEFVDYMNKYNLWPLLDDNKLIFSPWMGAEHYLNILGKGISKADKQEMLKRI